MTHMITSQITIIFTIFFLKNADSMSYSMSYSHNDIICNVTYLRENITVMCKANECNNLLNNYNGNYTKNCTNNCNTCKLEFIIFFLLFILTICSMFFAIWYCHLKKQSNKYNVFQRKY